MSGYRLLTFPFIGRCFLYLRFTALRRCVAAICWRHFRIIFWMKIVVIWFNCHGNFLWSPLYQCKRRHVIIWINAGLLYWLIYASHFLDDESIRAFFFYHILLRHSVWTKIILPIFVCVFLLPWALIHLIHLEDECLPWDIMKSQRPFWLGSKLINSLGYEQNFYFSSRFCETIATFTYVV